MTIQYTEEYVSVSEDNKYEIIKDTYEIEILPKKSKLGIMIVGLGGNNGSTFVIGKLANEANLSWENKRGIQNVNFYGSLSQKGSVHIGYKQDGKPYTKLFKDMLDINDINDLVIGGWDICKNDLYIASKLNQVVDHELRNKLKTSLENITPLKSVHYPTFLASNQDSRADNVLNNKNKIEDVNSIITDINNFKYVNGLDNVIVLWSASTERFSKGSWKTSEELIKSITENDSEISPSIIFTVASILSKCIFLNCSPQNTLNDGVIDLSKKMGTFLGGDDLKSGQTKLKSCLLDFLSLSGIKTLSIASYNHLGNQDGLNLSEYPQFKSKEITKRDVIDDVVLGNPQLYNNIKPDHCVVIEYLKSIGDSKRAMDEYYSELFLDGRHNLSIHNICEDSLLAVPIMIDLVLFSDLFSRVRISKNGSEFKAFSNVLSFLSFFFKAPASNENEPVINTFFSQRYGLENFCRILNGLPTINYINLHSRF